MFEKKKRWTDEEKFEKLTEFTIKEICARVEKEVPKEGHFPGIGQFFSLPGTENLVQIQVIHPSTAPSWERCVRLGVYREGGDRLHEIFLKTGTKEEVLHYLGREGLTKEWMDDIRRLSERVQQTV